MDRMKRIMALSFSILAVALLASASSWEGSAMMGSYGDFPPGGYFAACNSFPRNTAVEVTNLESGKTVTVIIVRGLDNPGVFMMVSAEAAEALGLRQGKITRVRAVEPRSVSSLAPSAGARTALDPDFNPRLLAAEELERMGYDIVEAPVKTEAEPAVTPTVAPEVAEAAGVPEVPAEAPEVLPPETETIAAAPEEVPGIIEPMPPVIAPLPVEPLDEGPQLVQDLIRPEPAAPEAVPVPVPTPDAPRVAADERPDAINGGKPKPVRTVVLPELPEPEAPAALAVVDPLPMEAESGQAEVLAVDEPGPEILAMTLPVPDETPIRVNPSPAPRRFEAPAALPDVLDKPTALQMAPQPMELSLVEPEVEADEAATAEVLGAPPVAGEPGSFALTEPGIIAVEPATTAVEPGTTAADGIPGKVVAHELLTPSMRDGFTLASLAWPELEADEIPDVVLARLTEPVQMVPATSLAEGEVIFPSMERPSAIALETPSFSAAETRIALAAPDVEAVDQAEVLDPVEPGTLASDLDVEIAEAEIAIEAPLIAGSETPLPVETLPEEASDTPALEDEAPGEVVIVMEPTDLRPPVADAPVVAEQEPAVTVEVPVPVAEVPVSPAVVARPAMATGSLEKGRHYIQVGAYRTEAVAAETVSVLRMDYVIVLEAPSGSSTRIWKIFVGPLGRDESGMALLRVRSLGFKDAFLKIGG